METFPLVSIGMPVYNGEAYLRGALAALVEQDYMNFEIVLSDNASTDATEVICREYVARDGRIRYLRRAQNTPAYENFNYVFRESRGEFFMWAAYDDMWHPSFVSRCVEALSARPEAVLCHSFGQPISPTGKAIGSPLTDCSNEERDLRARWHRTMTHWPLSEAVYGLMRSDAARKTRLMTFSLGADLIFVAEMAIHGEIIQVPETLFWKRRPEALEDYRSQQEMLDYVAGSQHKRPVLVRLAILREALRGLRHARVSEQARRELARDTFRAYLKERFLLSDLKEYAALKIGRARYRKWVRIKSALKDKGAKEELPKGA